MFWKRLSAVLACLILTPALSAAPPEAVSKADPRSPQDERKALRLPEGFDIELVAAEPEIHKPMNIAFDDQGRLWVTSTVEYPFPVGPGQAGRDEVKILFDFGPDGLARKVETFAGGLNIPIGLLPMPTDSRGDVSAFVFSIPNILRFSNHGQSREPAYATYGRRDTHGLTNAFTWGFDGWIYATHGYSNESRVEGSDKQAITMQSGNVYRMKADGSHLEYYSHGQVNPFGLAFDPLGYLYSSDCHSKPVYQLIRGAYYPSFGKPDDGLGFGPEMATHDHGSTAIAGIVYYAAEHFPVAFRDNIFIGNVVTNRVNRDTIEWHGSSPKAIEQPDFIVSDDPWFRPVDLKLGPDGALYIADFYNRIIGHYEVPLTHPGRDRERGRIWRVVYRGKGDRTLPEVPKVSPGIQPSTRDLIRQLGYPNLIDRTLASNQLATGFGSSLSEDRLHDEIDRADSASSKVHLLWLLLRADALASRDRSFLTQEIIEKAAADPDRTVRVHTMRILGERPELGGKSATIVRETLKDPNPHVRRAAAETLGRHPDTANIKLLLALRASTQADDTHLIHTTRIALRDQLRKDSVWTWLDTQSLTDAEAAGIADVATGVHSAASAKFLLAHLKARLESRANRVRYVHHIARYVDPKQQPELLSFIKSDSRDGLLGQVALLKAFHVGMQERGGQLSGDDREFASELIRALLASPHANEISEGINQAAAFRLEGLRDRLVALASDAKTPQPQRLDALSALPAINPRNAAPLLGKTLADASTSFLLRERAAFLLGANDLAEGRAELLKNLPTAPEPLQKAIAAGLAARKLGAEALLDAIASGKASARLLQDNRIIGLLGNAKVPNLSNRVAALLKDLPPADARLNALIAARRDSFAASKADAALGAKVFEKHCAICHQIGGKGAKVGPQLEGVGVRGLDRILEDVLDPSRNVDQTFRTTILALKDGRVVSGLLVGDEGAVLRIADAQGKEIQVLKDSVDERTSSPLSPMPANFSDQVSEADFQSLIAYLLSQRPPS
jgi:putative heme-binding domain-containing protein